MTRLLVSVVDRAEARLALAQGADLIDAKDPSAGALGALPLATIAAIRADLPADTVTSAVAGDDEDIGRLAQSALAIAATGVTYVKLGLGHRTARPQAVAELGRLLTGRGRFITVLFADEDPPLALTTALREAGFAGAMLDTRRKSGVRLPDLLPAEALAAFVADCRRQGLLCGLAGSLRRDDIPALASLDPDYLGFRGGLCRAGDRRGELDPLAIAEAAARLAALRQGERAA
ncbi:(5-formylfuran-3-yl)methyl phosphate synthase [Labrys neptuniae]